MTEPLRALVTGVASGIGRSLAKALRDRGDQVFGVDHQSGAGWLQADLSMPAERTKAVQSALAERFPVELNELVVYPTNYACPSAVFCDPRTGEHFGMTYVMSPWSGAVAA